MKTKNTDTTYDFPSIGCYFSDCAGQEHNDKRVIKLAQSYGYEIDAEYKNYLEKVEMTLDDDLADLEPYEFLLEESDSAIEFLNELETRPYYYWAWNDGSFCLSINTEGAQEDLEKYNNLADVDLGFEGEFLVVSDHGNLTMYVRGQESFDDGKKRGTLVVDKEIWSVV